MNFGLKYVVNEEWSKLRDMQLHPKFQIYLDVK